MGEVRNGDQKVRKYLFSEIFYGRQAVFNEDFFQELLGLEGSKKFLERSRTVSNDPRVFSKKIFLVLYAVYAYPFWVVSL